MRAREKSRWRSIFVLFGDREKKEVRDRRREKGEEKTYSSMSASPLLAICTSFAPTLHSATTTFKAAVVGWKF